MAVKPVSAEEVAELVQSSAHVCAVGAGTKSGLIGEGEKIEFGGLTGVIEYESSEYTFTALAGTPVAEVEEVLGKKGQYLPFDPLFVEAGATLGGTVASGVSGPGRFRFGGLRDFLIGVQFVDGHGALVRSGGKVVKNAAGFDLPKFLVGSLGRYGLMTELSFKVFPAPFEVATLAVPCPNHVVAVERMTSMASSRWEPDALDYDPARKTLHVRLGGPGKALVDLCDESSAQWQGDVKQMEDETVWSDAREARWAEGEFLGKTVMTPSRMASLIERLEDYGSRVQCWCSSGGNVAWLSCDGGELSAVSKVLEGEGLEALVVRGKTREGPWLGASRGGVIRHAVKEAIDPGGRFPGI